MKEDSELDRQNPVERCQEGFLDVKREEKPSRSGGIWKEDSELDRQNPIERCQEGFSDVKREEKPSRSGAY